MKGDPQDSIGGVGGGRYRDGSAPGGASAGKTGGVPLSVRAPGGARVGAMSERLKAQVPFRYGGFRTKVPGFLLLSGVLSMVALAIGASAATSLDAGVSEVSQNSALVTWSHTQDWCFTSYDLQWRSAGTTNWNTARSITNADETSYRVVGLSPDKEYEYRVVDVDCMGSQASLAGTFRTNPAGYLGLDDGTWFALLAAGTATLGILGYVSLRAYARRRAAKSAPYLVPLDNAHRGLKKCASCGKPVASSYCGDCGARQS